VKTGKPEGERRRRQSFVKMHDDFPSVCSRCGSNELKDVRNVREKPEHFERFGVTYTHAKRFYSTCKGCGQTRAVCRRLIKVKDYNTPDV